ncbi:isocitrate lyase/PEP mutase family protein [Actinokineospora inagensis]|uniref:isocitrate lyase/PEP mutase family protein n=1 Tax=Actinokineospora inagensis TaxID=103730 RepID=UPI000409A908|nr:isocitrate lyase/phosphoenolpyruvate mutase family protein [Actinokineospora inagensis]
MDTIGGSTGAAVLANRFRAMHDGPDVLVLPNAWDPGSAALLASLPGVRAVATSSAGVAAARGLPDGERLSLDQVVDTVEGIVRSVTVPVSVDLETGYGHDPAEVADSVSALIDLGAVGVNLEDGSTRDPTRLLAQDDHAERIAAAKSAGAQAGVPVVVNARTDVYWRAVGDQEKRLAEATTRLRAYRDAGADCVFVPGFPERGLDRDGRRAAVATLLSSIGDVPLNLLAGANVPSVLELRALGVRRLTTGSGLYRLGMAAVLDAASELIETGEQEALSRAEHLSYQRLAETLAHDPPV